MLLRTGRWLSPLCLLALMLAALAQSAPQQSSQTQAPRRANNMFPAWSFDGKQIAFVSIRENGQEFVYRMNADGSALERVTGTPDKVSTPSWSPDGRRIGVSLPWQDNPG